MTNATLNGTNRITDHLGNGNGKATASPAAREDYIGKIVLVEPPIGTFGAGEYIIVDQTNNALYGVKLCSAYDGHEVKLIPLIGPVAWTIVRAEPDTSGLIESTILLLSEFAATPPEIRNEGLEDCIYEGAEYAAGALLRMLERRQQQRCQALLRELERIEREAIASFYEKQTSANGSGSDNTKLTAKAAADNDPIPVLLIDLVNFDMALAWLV
jgi:hypothetical protein